MRGILGSVFLLILFIGCSPEIDYETESKFTNGEPEKIVGYQLFDGKKVKVEEKKFYEHGKTEYHGFYDENRKKHGLWQYWYPDGKLWSQGEFEHGKREGKSTVYYKGGSKRYEGQYKNDKPYGHWLFWDKQGKLALEKDFEQD